MIHPTAIIDPTARIGSDVEIGPYSIIGANVEIGDGCWIQHHVTIMGPTKIGKSTWCSHSEGALFLATEAGLNNLEAFQVPISTWEQFLAACGEIAAGNHPFKTVIVDTVDNLYRMCADYVCAKHKVEHESDLAYGKGYALITNEFYRVLNKLALLPYGLFLISHAQEREFETRTGKVMGFCAPNAASRRLTSRV